MAVRTNSRYSKRKRSRNKYSKRKHSKRKYSKRKYSKRKYSKRKYSKRNSNKKIQFGGALDGPRLVAARSGERGYYQGVIEKGIWGGRVASRDGVGRLIGGWRDMNAQERSVRFYPQGVSGNGKPELYYGKPGAMTGVDALQQNRVEIQSYRLPKSRDIMKGGVPDNVLRITATKTQEAASAGWMGGMFGKKDAAQVTKTIEDGYWVCSTENIQGDRDAWITIFQRAGIPNSDPSVPVTQPVSPTTAAGPLATQPALPISQATVIGEKDIIIEAIRARFMKGGDSPWSARLVPAAKRQLITICEMMWQANLTADTIVIFVNGFMEEMLSEPGTMGGEVMLAALEKEKSSLGELTDDYRKLIQYLFMYTELSEASIIEVLKMKMEHHIIDVATASAARANRGLFPPPPSTQGFDPRRSIPGEFNPRDSAIAPISSVTTSLPPTDAEFDVVELGAAENQAGLASVKMMQAGAEPPQLTEEEERRAALEARLDVVRND